MLPKDKLHWAAPEEPALSLLDRMRTIGMQQMPVIAGGNVVGIVTRDSILRVLQTRHEISSLAGNKPDHMKALSSTGFSLSWF